MSMVLGDLLEMIRQDYIDTLRAAAEEAGQGGLAVLIEPEFEEDKSFLNKILWGDLRVGSKLETVASEGVFRFDEAISFGWGDALPGLPEPLQVQVLPFAWDAMGFQLKAPPADFDATPLSQWLAQWAMPEEPETEESEATETEGLGVVHSLFALGENRWRADMGTAPLEAWQDLLEALLASGATEVKFGENKA